MLPLLLNITDSKLVSKCVCLCLWEKHGGVCFLSQPLSLFLLHILHNIFLLQIVVVVLMRPPFMASFSSLPCFFFFFFFYLLFKKLMSQKTHLQSIWTESANGARCSQRNQGKSKQKIVLKWELVHSFMVFSWKCKYDERGQTSISNNVNEATTFIQLPKVMVWVF